MNHALEYLFRSKDGLYRVVLPSWSSPDRSISFRLASPESDDDKVRVSVEEVADEPNRDLLDKMMTKAQSPFRDQEVTQWAGTIDGMPAARRTTTGVFSWLRGHIQVVDDTILVGLGGEANGYRVGTVSRIAEANTAAARRDLLSIVTPTCTPPPATPSGSMTLQVRGFGVSVSDDWRPHFRGLGGHRDFGPPQPSHWGGDEPAPGYKISWSISGYISDLDDDVQWTKNHWSVPFDEHGGLQLPVYLPDGPALADYLAVDVPALEYPTVPSLDIHGKEVQVEDSRSRLAHHRFIAWIRIGPTGGCSLSMRVERGSRDRSAQMWADLLSCIFVQETSP